MRDTQTDRSVQLYMKKIAAMDKNGYYLTQKVQFSIYHQIKQKPSPYQSEVDVLYKSLQIIIAKERSFYLLLHKTHI